MAEISYPFNEANANGGSPIVSETEWQAMARLWGGDRVDFTLTSTSYTAAQLPFSGAVVNGRTVEINPGKAWVGGFYYTLTAKMGLTIPNNNTTNPRKDLIVIQADMAKSAVNLAVVTGTPAATPKTPTPRRQPGGIWEMPLYEVTAAANNASVTISLRMPFSMPERVAYPWNNGPSAELQPRGSFTYDMDSNGGDSQNEGFIGRDGFVITRHLGKSREYTPTLTNSNAQPATRKGRWRYIAPNTVWFSVYMQNTSNSDYKVPSSTGTFGVTLPVAANALTGQLYKGFLDNNTANAGGLPNFIDLTAMTRRGTATTTAYLYMPNINYSAKTGLDGIRVFPRKAWLVVSGVYEADQF
ncbi:hypothetical protein [Streptomyces pseudogriseolus]|uniref:hypothetical protein n=1 Tax=Streptomyces pseudogriseolus TaxID=36817 RepID=UPI003FA1E26C